MDECVRGCVSDNDFGERTGGYRSTKQRGERAFGLTALVALYSHNRRESLTQPDPHSIAHCPVPSPSHLMGSGHDGFMSLSSPTVRRSCNACMDTHTHTHTHTHARMRVQGYIRRRDHTAFSVYDGFVVMIVVVAIPVAIATIVLCVAAQQ